MNTDNTDSRNEKLRNILEFSDLIINILISPSGEIPASLEAQLQPLRALLAEKESLETSHRDLCEAISQINDINSEIRNQDALLAEALKSAANSVRGLASLCLKAVKLGQIESETALEKLLEAQNQVKSTREKLDTLESGQGIIEFSKSKARQALLAGNLLLEESRFGKICHSFEMKHCGSNIDSPYICEATRAKFSKIAAAYEPVMKINEEISKLLMKRDNVHALLNSDSESMAGPPTYVEKTSDSEILTLHLELIESRMEETIEKIKGLEPLIIEEVIKQGNYKWSQKPVQDFLCGIELQQSLQDQLPREFENSPEIYHDPLFVSSLISAIPLDPEFYRNPFECDFRKKAESVMFSRDSIISYYKNITEKIQKTELASKIQCGADQFSYIHEMNLELSKCFGISPPDIFIFHRDDYYGAESDGLVKPWICLYAENLKALDPAELRFILAREIAHIRCDHTLYRIISRSLVGTTELLNGSIPIPGLQQLLNIMGKERVRHFIRSMLHEWLWATEYTADCAGYLAVSGNLNACFNAMMKSVARTSRLADQVDLKAWYRQIEKLDQATGFMARYSMIEQDIPYGQFRIRELMGYASSARAKKALELLG
ncbi:MAG: hypothetical protein CVV64_16085 [Candidatus Wallbacteria bacterium HGW-Wallbacteria-1]|uniref:Peptidase M48 domain-containing protein n=1 Tax=Candidatus Wallbacteria bacterium HGW-Wallbacteria-1 TaxID=2013854 RepID=A0A2N1PL61_9BACT|nr:MAG: hypothetical protein CVV64_16085 [Candidatus Wallbacteria bacterium HGW-Wallbacteria-1]